MSIKDKLMRKALTEAKVHVAESYKGNVPNTLAAIAAHAPEFKVGEHVKAKNGPSGQVEKLDNHGQVFFRHHEVTHGPFGSHKKLFKAHPSILHHVNGPVQEEKLDEGMEHIVAHHKKALAGRKYTHNVSGTTHTHEFHNEKTGHITTLQHDTKDPEWYGWSYGHKKGGKIKTAESGNDEVKYTSQNRQVHKDKIAKEDIIASELDIQAVLNEAKWSYSDHAHSVADTTARKHNVKVGDRVTFMKKSLAAGGAEVEHHGRVIYDHGNGKVNIDTNSPLKKSKAYPSTVHKDKITKIHEETISELSKKTLKSYAKKAKSWQKDMSNVDPYELHHSDIEKMNQRDVGIDRATKKLTKEQTLAEAKKPAKKGKVARKYLGAQRGKTATGKPAHKIEISPVIGDSNPKNKTTVPRDKNKA